MVLLFFVTLFVVILFPVLGLVTYKRITQLPGFIK